MVDINFEKVVDVETYEHTLSEDVADFQNMLIEAKDEISFYNWCLNIVESYVGIFYANIVGVFLFRINPSVDDVDEWVWVIVGDLPPIYITAEESPNAACALDSYIGAMEEWIEAAEKGESVSELIPVNVLANEENANSLKIRLTMLSERILSQYKEDLKA
ncbi:MAG: hypothetical protein ACC707_09990 [Thiohalomonadales bacterium]